MSRLAKKSILIPSKVKIEQKNNVVIVTGALGMLQQPLRHEVTIEIENNNLKVLRKNDSKLAKALQGTVFVILSNCIKGVQEGFIKKLQLVGVGFKAKITGSKLELGLGKSHPIKYEVPEGIKVETPTATDIIVSGIDKQKVGQVAADIRAFKRPEKYKGKGIRYFDEVIELKETKSSKK